MGRTTPLTRGRAASLGKHGEQHPTGGFFSIVAGTSSQAHSLVDFGRLERI